MDPEGDFYICRWKVKGVAGGACKALKNGSEDSAGGKGLATASGMDKEIFCLVLFYFCLYFGVSKGRFRHSGRNSAAVTGTMICFLLPFSVQFPRKNEKKETLGRGFPWEKLVGSLQESVGLQHRVRRGQCFHQPLGQGPPYWWVSEWTCPAVALL